MTTQIEFIKTADALKLLNPVDNLVETLEEEYRGLTITDPHDKDQIAVVENAMRVVRDHRIEVNKKAKFINSNINDFKKLIKEANTKLVNGLNGIYEPLKQKRDDALLFVKNEKEAEEKARMEAWTNKSQMLLDAGFLSNGVQFIAGPVIVDAENLHDIENNDLEAIIEKGKAELERIAQILRDNKKLIDETIKKGKVVGFPEKTDVEFHPPNATQTETPSVHDTPFDINEKGFDTVKLKDESEEAIKTVPDGFLIGWNAHKTAVIELLESTQTMTRQDLIKKIRNLAPE